MQYVIPDLKLSIQTILRKNGLRNTETSIATALPFTLNSLHDSPVQMAALSALRNRNSQKMREGFESFLAKCVESSNNKSEVDLSYIVRTMEENNIKLDQKEISRLEKICDNNNKINRYKNTN